MEGVGIGDWITIFFGAFTILSGIIFAFKRNHVLLQECTKKIEVLFNLINQIKDRDKRDY